MRTKKDTQKGVTSLHMEQLLRGLLTTKPSKRVRSIDVPKPDSKNTIHTPYRLKSK